MADGATTSRTSAAFPCPCCGHLVFDEPPGSYAICPICFWEDDPVQLRWPDYTGGANRPSLREAQRAFAEVGACEFRLTGVARGPAPDEPIEPGWRPITDSDQFEDPNVSLTNRRPWPCDETVLYWWRDTFWGST